MPHVRFTRNLERHVDCPAAEVAGETVRAALEAYFADRPAVRSYVLDDGGSLRRHMVIFVDGRPVSDRAGLGDRLEDESVLDVMQALSGG